MKAGIPVRTIRRPIAVQTRRAISVATARAAGAGQPARKTSTAATPPVSPTPDPAERSICPGRMTRSIPTASTAVTASSIINIDRLRGDRNSGDASVKPAARTASTPGIVRSRSRVPFITPESSPPRSWDPSRAESSCPTMSARTRSWSSSDGVSSDVIRPSRRTSTRSLSPSNSGSSLVTSTTRLAFQRQPVDPLVDLELGRHIDAACRLIQQEHPRLGQEHAAQEHLLLVAAGEVVDPCRRSLRGDPQRAHHLAVHAEAPRPGRAVHVESAAPAPRG